MAAPASGTGSVAAAGSATAASGSTTAAAKSAQLAAAEDREDAANRFSGAKKTESQVEAEEEAAEDKEIKQREEAAEAAKSTKGNMARFMSTGLMWPSMIETNEAVQTKLNRMRESSWAPRLRGNSRH